MLWWAQSSLHHLYLWESSCHKQEARTGAVGKWHLLVGACCSEPALISAFFPFLWYFVPPPFMFYLVMVESSPLQKWWFLSHSLEGNDYFIVRYSSSLWCFLNFTFLSYRCNKIWDRIPSVVCWVDCMDSCVSEVSSKLGWNRRQNIICYTTGRAMNQFNLVIFCHSKLDQ